MPPINEPPIRDEVRAACRDDNPTELLAPVGGDVEEPGDDSDIHAGAAAQRKAIMAQYSGLLKSAPKEARRAIKEQRNAALAGIKRRASGELHGRKRLRRERKLRRLPTVRTKSLSR
jgi:hypothetical protein